MFKDGLKIHQGLHEQVDYLLFSSCTINVHQDVRCCLWMTWMGSRRSKIEKKTDCRSELLFIHAIPTLSSATKQQHERNMLQRGTKNRAA